mmetsp:Transcript_39239/g.104782  ORF Transcript_39239/g.104782 Transcript_39239/m.104782 type:complete len:816 (+) Transcript_39239:142-2589(+)
MLGLQEPRMPRAAAGLRSPASWRRNACRRQAWFRRPSRSHDALPGDRLQLLARVVRAACELPGAFLRHRLGRGPPLSGRQRDIFPLPLLGVKDELRPSGALPRRWEIHREFANCSLAALNFLYGVRLAPGASKRTAAQTDVLRRVLSRVIDFGRRLEEAVDGNWEHLLPDWVTGVPRPGKARYDDLVASRVDNLEQAAGIDTQALLSEEARSLVLDPQLMFPDPPAGLSSFETFRSGERSEYVKLVALQLRAGKLGLCSSPAAGGTVLAISKQGSARQREVWHGRRVSLAAVRPPRPRHLACPSSLLRLESTVDRPLRVSKRDARCWFDQLAAPQQLRRWFARPSVTQQELYKWGGFTSAELRDHFEPGTSLEHQVLWPVSRVWPMGFSWSSYVAQETLLELCARSGVTEGQLMSCDLPTPLVFGNVAALATDDAMFFSNAGPGHTLAMAHAFERSLAGVGGEKQAKKDVDDSLHATCVGVDLERGVQLGVPPGRCVAVVVSALQLLRDKRASPKQLHQVLGVMQWFDLLRRPKLSVYSHVYDFVRDPEDTRPQLVPDKVLEEILLGVLLAPFWLADLTRPWCPLVAAADASTQFGFGASVLAVHPNEARRVARVAEKRGDYVVLDRGVRAAGYFSRLGQPHILDVRFDDFVHIFSVRSRRTAHINILEGEAFVLLLRWILRRRDRHSTRVVVLCDSAVWAGAATKGRSSSGLARTLRRAAALEMAGDLQVEIVLVPSEENPSDLPSRGVRWKDLPEEVPASAGRARRTIRRHLPSPCTSPSSLSGCASPFSASSVADSGFLPDDAVAPGCRVEC